MLSRRQIIKSLGALIGSLVVTGHHKPSHPIPPGHQSTTTTTTAPTTTTTTTTSPTTPRNVLWSTSFENGYSDYIKSDPYSNSGNARGEIVDAPGRAGKAVAMSVTDASAGTGVRLRQDGATIEIPGYSGAENLPDAAYYSARFYIPTHISIGSGDGSKSVDTWNIFQWKQTWPRGDGRYTRRMIASIKLRDLGNSYGFTVASRAHDDGTWGDPKDEWLVGDANAVRAGEWFHLEAYRKLSSDPSVGRLIVWVNGVEIFDRHMLTELTGGSWDDFGRWRRQWTDNNYVTGNNHSPNTHTLFVTDLAIAA